MPTAASLMVKFNADTKGFDAGAKKVTSTIGGFGKTALGVAAGLGIHQVLSKVVGSFSDAIGGAIAFDREMANVNSIAQVSQAQLGKIADQVNALAGPTAQAPEVLAAGLYDIYSSGFKAGDAMTVLTAAANAATAGVTGTDVAARAITATLNAYGLGADQASAVSDVLFQTVQDGVISFEQLANNMGNTLPIAASLGISIQELGAAYAQMTLKGVQGAQAETQIAALMRSALNPTDALTAAVQAQGFSSASAAIEQKGLAGFIDIVTKAAGGNKEALFSLLGTQEAMNAATILGADGVKGYRKEIDKMNHASDGAGATQKALTKQMDSAAFKIKQAQIAVKQFVTLGFGLLAPIVGKIATSFSHLILNGLIPFTKIIGEALKGQFGFTKAVEALPQPLQRTAHAVGVVVEGFTDLIAFAKRGDWDRFFTRLPGELEQIRGGFDAIGDELGQGIHWFADITIGTAAHLAGFLGNHIGDIWGGIKELAGWTVSTFAETVTATITGAITLAGDLGKIGGDLWAWIRAKVMGLPPEGDLTGGPDPFGANEISVGTVVITALTELGGALKAAADNLLVWLKSKFLGGNPGDLTGGPNPFGAMSIPIGTVLVDAGLELAETIWGGATDAAGWITTQLQTAINAAGKIAPKLPVWTLDVLIPTLGGWVDGAGSWLNTKLQLLIDGIARISPRFADWLVDVGIPALSGWATGATAWLNTKLQSLIDGIERVAPRFKDWVIDVLAPKLVGWVDTIHDWMDDHLGKAVDDSDPVTVDYDNYKVNVKAPPPDNVTADDGVLDNIINAVLNKEPLSQASKDSAHQHGVSAGTDFIGFFNTGFLDGLQPISGGAAGDGTGGPSTTQRSGFWAGIDVATDWIDGFSAGSAAAVVAKSGGFRKSIRDSIHTAVGIVKAPIDWTVDLAKPIVGWAENFNPGEIVIDIVDLLNGLEIKISDAFIWALKLVTPVISLGFSLSDLVGWIGDKITGLGSIDIPLGVNIIPHLGPGDTNDTLGGQGGFGGIGAGGRHGKSSLMGSGDGAGVLGNPGNGRFTVPAPDTSGALKAISGVQDALQGLTKTTYQATLDLTPAPFTSKLAASVVAGLAFAKLTFIPTLDALNVPFVQKVADAIGAGNGFARMVFAATLDALNGPFVNALGAAIGAGNGFGNMVFTASLDANTTPFWQAVNGIAGTTVGTAYMNLVANPLQATVKGKAGGGLVTEPFTLVGERGPEVVSLPRGSYVHTAAASRGMMGSPTTITINVSGTGNPEAVARAVHRELTRELVLSRGAN